MAFMKSENPVFPISFVSHFVKAYLYLKLNMTLENFKCDFNQRCIILHLDSWEMKEVLSLYIIKYVVLVSGRFR